MTEILGQSFQLLESRAQRAMRENNANDNLADVILEEEELPFWCHISPKTDGAYWKIGYTLVNPKYFSYLLKDANESWCFLLFIFYISTILSAW